MLFNAFYISKHFKGFVQEKLMLVERCTYLWKYKAVSF
jgi:hypothetical protein